ncbi:fibronectin type III domain-containing protein [Paractinoplanes lichenicola]|uniref:Fibronectin type III domain-containing protein n=1 Tax=Paractinoplanes lichenicola TaxID=2802976 RepID=A0ABS1W154_9ACTN|nr:fibronectin type III domain-containing protein [Actinoplanes lichenicola]MBL7260466.1 fibronectin type III domain-containing protein [Actinoplanes lichenicola]
MNWESAVLQDGDYTYGYGTERAPGRMTFAHVSRTQSGGERQYWTGTTWSAEPGESARLLSGVGASFAVLKLPPLYVLVTREHNLPSDTQLVAYTALSPTGPFDGPHHHGTVPETLTVQADPARGKLIISYGGQAEAGWPFWPRSTTPPAPRNLTVTAKDDHAYLSWRHIDRVTGYRVYQRDVTAGQTHFARLPVAFDSSMVHVGQLIPGHTYEFRVATLMGATEGPLSETVTATPHSTRPAADVIRFAGTPEAIEGTYLFVLYEGVVDEDVEQNSWATLD